MKVAIIFGGAGYIGSFLVKRFIEIKRFDKIYVFDLNIKPFFDIQFKEGRLEFLKGDVRNPIEISINEKIDLDASWIFNLAAVHREPGHEFNEYFDTNIAGATNINEFAISNGFKNIFFTSSIAPYGKSLEARNETSNLYPETAYGISKALCEKIHEKWLAGDSSRKLIIVRPSVIFGPGDPGNVFRMIKGIKRGSFVLPNGGNVVKGYGYIYGLLDSINFTMSKEENFIIYNYAENPLQNLRGMVDIVKDELKYRKPTFSIPVRFLSFVAFFIQIIFKLLGKKTDIHPVRVRKAGFPTYIVPKYLIDNNFEFKYDFRSALKHWTDESPKDFE
ncbi:N-acetyl-alpha-D-glucosaminyl-diphospho-ditrans, octacis-undecaprenol 4-epimerase [Urechidicola sp. KH5]